MLSIIYTLDVRVSHVPSQIVMFAETVAELFGSLGSTDEALLFLELACTLSFGEQ